MMSYTSRWVSMDEFHFAWTPVQEELKDDSSDVDPGQPSISRRPAPMPLEALEKIQAAQV